MTSIDNLPTDLIQTISNNLNGKLIRDSNDADIQKTLLQVFILIGLRTNHFPDELTNKFIINYIRKEFHHRTLEELLFAFDLAIKQEYNFDCKVYDNFSIEYLVRIMTGYRSWLFEKNKTIKKVEPEIQIVNNYTKAEKLKDVDEYLNRADLNTSNLHLIPLFIFDNMKDLGMIDLSDEKIVKRYSKSLKIYESYLFQEASKLKSDAIKKYNRFLKYKQDEFQNLAQDIIIEIENIYKRYSVLQNIIQHQLLLKTK